MLFLPLALLSLPLTYGAAVPPIPRNAERLRNSSRKQQQQHQLALAEQLPPSPQFIGCVSRDFISTLVPGETGDEHRSGVRIETSKEACTGRCATSPENKYAYFNDRDSECFCSAEQFPSSSDYRGGKDSVGTCKSSQTSVTYLPAPFTFTSCSAPRSSPSASVHTTFEAPSQQFCFDACNATPNANIATLTPTYDAEQDWWFFQCSCSAEGASVRELLLSGAGSGGRPGWGARAAQMAFGDRRRSRELQEAAREMKVEVEMPVRCGFDSVFRYERPILD
ncbi:hypothetical protein IAT38_007586 [Cryptococcus sp. DSM 104549]